MAADAVQIALTSSVNVRPAAVVAASVDQSTGVDLTGYEGVAKFVWTTGAITGTMDPLIQDSADNSTFANVTGLTAAQVTTANQIREIAFDVRSVRRYVRAQSTVGTTSCAFSVTMIAQKKVTG